MQLFNLVLAIVASLVTAEEAVVVPECQQKIITKFIHSKPVKHHRPCPPVNCEVCPFQLGDLFLLRDKVPFFKAECACREKGGVLAALDGFNFVNATNVQFNCIGPNSYSWIKSWNTDNYGHSCLALFTGSTPGGGAVAVPISCNNRVSVLCQRMHKHCDKHDNCHDFIWDWSSDSSSSEKPCHRRDHECHSWWESCDSCKPHHDHPHSHSPRMKFIN
jgi:hypothetical protein